MLILHSQPRVLLPIPNWQWREPSIGQPHVPGWVNTQHGLLHVSRANQVTFVIEQWRRDGGLVDRRRFDDRDEFDYELWRVLREPFADIVPMWATVVTLTTTSASNQDYVIPSDYGAVGSRTDCIGPGGAGGADKVSSGSGSAAAAGGGGAGGRGYLTNGAFTPGATVAYRLPPGTTAVVNSGSGDDGGDCWFGAATYADATVGAHGGVGGNGGVLSGGGAGGTGKGTGFFTGGDGSSRGSIPSDSAGAGGGGGAPSASANGNNGASGSGGGASAGGAGDGVLAGAGGNGGLNANGSAGGNYGGGGGATATRQSITIQSGGGAQGVIVFTYTPAASGNFFMMF